MQIHSFIFNWRGQYEKAKLKEEQLKRLGIKVTVINSDDNNREDDWVNIGEQAYFTEQFLMALKLFEGDVLFHIQADASYDKWEELIEDGKKYYSKYNWGIYAPNVDYTWYDSSRTDIGNIKVSDNNLRMVACPDCTCWFIHKDVITDLRERNIDMSPYSMGWGWDIILPALSFLKSRAVLRDYNHTIDHPPGTNYNKTQAEKEMHALFDSLPNDLKMLFYWIKGDRLQIAKFFEGI